MADAKKYDRCGKLYECCDKIMPFQSIKTVYVSYWKGRGEVNYDLCPDCMKFLQKWFKGKECEENEI